MSSGLPDWLIATIARDAGIDFKIKGDKAAIKCPLHDDRSASAIITARNAYYCSCCTPDGGWPAKKFCTALGLRWESYTRGAPREAPAPRPIPSKPSATFTPDMARAAWDVCLQQSRNDHLVESDQPSYDYLCRRELLEAVELRVIGILGERAHVPSELSRWWRGGYRVVCPLYDQGGELVCIQARTIFDRKPKTLFPGGSHVTGTFFADSRALKLIRAQEAIHTAVVVAEGLTDFAALAIASPIPVVSAPGTGFAKSVAGPWARGLQVLIALDLDTSGAKAVQVTGKAFHAHGAASVRRIGWPHGCKDACDMLANCGSAALRDFIDAQIAKGVA